MRFLNKRVPPGYDTVPLVLFWGLLVLWLVPWAVFLPQALREVPFRWRELRSGWTAASARICSSSCGRW